MTDTPSRADHETWVKAARPLVDGLVKLVRVRDESTAIHLEAVGMLSRRLAVDLGYSHEIVDRVELAARLHDVGKQSIALSILRKPGPLTDDEWAEMRQHPDHGANMVSCFPELERLVPIVRAHHERIDGRGYPSRLSGSNIPLESRIIAVADAFHAMTVSRPYVAARTPVSALQELISCAETQFDADYVHAFVTMLGARKNLVAGSQDVGPSTYLQRLFSA